jgi:hypothetical protein
VPLKSDANAAPANRKSSERRTQLVKACAWPLASG